MPVELSPETERLIEEEMRSGHFRSVDELIVEGVHAWRAQHDADAGHQKGEQSLVEFFRSSPLVGLELDFERDKDTGREVEL